MRPQTSSCIYYPIFFSSPPQVCLEPAWSLYTWLACYSVLCVWMFAQSLLAHRWWQNVGHSDPSGLWYTGRHGKYNTGTAVLYIATTSLLAVWCWPLVLSGVIWNQEQGVNRATCLSSGPFDMLGEQGPTCKIG